jgi:hypothetical protein
MESEKRGWERGQREEEGGEKRGVARRGDVGEGWDGDDKTHSTHAY